jgi:hypothetical protein
MGVDIFMGWKGMTERDRERQFKEYFSGQAGSVGYLRESYGNDFSLKLFEKIFPRKYWENIEAPYPFLKYHERNLEIIKIALIEMVSEEIKKSSKRQIGNSDDKKKSVFDVLSNVAEAHGEHLVITEEDKNKLDKIQIVIPDYSGIEYKIDAIISLIEFLRSGEILESQGKKPTIYISC